MDYYFPTYLEDRTAMQLTQRLTLKLAYEKVCTSHFVLISRGDSHRIFTEPANYRYGDFRG